MTLAGRDFGLLRQLEIMAHICKAVEVLPGAVNSKNADKMVGAKLKSGLKKMSFFDILVSLHLCVDSRICVSQRDCFQKKWFKANENKS